MAGENHINASYDKLHALNLDKYRKSIDTLYNHYIDECAKLGIATGLEEGSDVPFSFDNAPANIRKKYTDLMWRMRQDLESAIQNGVKKEWNLSIAKNDEMVEHLAGVTKMSKNDIGKLKVCNADALEAFQTRKNNGLGLSDRVWNITEQTKGEMEMAIELSLSSGQSASQLSRDVRQMLKEPDMMYRRFREKKQLSDGSSKWVKYWRRKVVDDNGQVHWIKEPLEHTGRGVYRSSYKNAMRLARTETNMAYHKADHDYWNKCDFVLGIKIVLSNNHPVYDICDEFKSKIFPKEFDFPGWHPQCRCRAVPILAKDTEVEDYLRRLADGEDVQGNYKFSGVVDKMPEEFGTWIKDNEGRLVAMQMRGRLPYFIQNNMAEGFKFGQGYDYNVGLKWSGNMFVSDIDTGKIIDVIDDTTTAQVDVLRQDLERYSPELQANFAELEKRIGQKRGLSMSWEDANKGKENPNFYLSQKKWIEVEKGKHTHYSWEDGRKRYYVLNKDFNEKWSGWGNNCQTCTLVHEMRRRGFNVEAIDNYRRKVWRVYDKQGVGSRMEGYRKGKWLKPDGTPVSPYYAEEWAAKKGISARSLPKHIDEYMEEMMRNDGRFEIYVDWKRGKAHVFLAEKKNGAVTFFDPQSGMVNVWDDGKGHGYKYECKPGRIGVIRIDNKMINPKLASTFIPRGELKMYADPAVLKAQRIEAAKQARLAKRTPEKERELLEFWEKKKAEGEKRRWRERLLKRAEERHAKRTQEQEQTIKKAWQERQHKHQLIKKAAGNILKVAQDYGEIDYSELQSAINAGDLMKMQSVTKDVAKSVVAMKKQEAALSDVIPDVHKWHKQFTLDELQDVKDSIQTFKAGKAAKYYSNNFDDLLLAKQKQLLMDEAKYVSDANYFKPHKLHKTWEVAKSAYEKQLAIVEEKIAWEATDIKLANIKAYSIANPKSTKIANLIAEAEEIKAAGGSVAKVEAKILEAEKIKAKNEASTLSKAKKAAKKKAEKLAQEKAALDAQKAVLESEIEQAKQSGDKVLLKAKQKEFKKVQAKLDKIEGELGVPLKIDFDEIPAEERERLIKEFEIKSGGTEDMAESADKRLRKVSETGWSRLSEDEKVQLTKYTETYNYLNEPLTGRTHYTRGYDEFEKDLPIMTSACGKFAAPEAMVVRRGTDDYFIPEIGKNLSGVKVGDEFINGSFLSTAARVDKGFFKSYDMVIVVPKGAHGVYAEPFTHYGGGDFKYETKRIWNGVSKERMGSEREWIGQRGFKFKVIEKKGRTIYLQIIGEMYDQVTEYEKYFR